MNKTYLIGLSSKNEAYNYISLIFFNKFITIEHK